MENGKPQEVLTAESIITKAAGVVKEMVSGQNIDSSPTVTITNDLSLPPVVGPGFMEFPNIESAINTDQVIADKPE